MKPPILYGPFTELITMHGLPLHGSLKDEELPVIKSGGIVVEDGVVIDTGDYHDLSAKYHSADKFLNDGEPLVATPAFVDCHTHICWAGDRSHDYALRVAGKSYLEIAKAGGGIMDTVLSTRAASQSELVEVILERTEKLLKQGIAIVEVKSGYGLDHENELKMLRAIKEANNKTPALLIPTFLGAHIKPKDFKGTHAEYLNELINKTIPVIKEEELADRADIFVEEGAFDIDISRAYAEHLREQGFEMTMHVDQFHPGGAELAIELDCVSADHLETTNEETIQKFRNSDTVAVALPGASLGLGMQYTPCRKLLDNDACVAIATDWNPGSAPMGDLLVQASLIGAAEKLSISEILAAITFRAAQALRIDAGVIHNGAGAGVAVFKTDSHRKIFYNQGQLKPAYTIINNECIEH